MEPLENRDVFLPKDRTCIVGLTLKSDSGDPSLQIYFPSMAEAIMSIFHPSIQNFLASDVEILGQGETIPGDSIEIYLNVFFVKDQVIVKRPS